MAAFTEEDKLIGEQNFDIQAAIQHFKEISVGAGSTIFKANSEGVFIGGTNFTDAPISFTYAGVQKVKTGGAIQVGDTVVIDATGLNSINNFLSDTWFDATNRTTTSTSYTDIPSASMASFVLTRNARILTYIRARTYNNNLITDGFNTQFQMYDTFDDSGVDGFTTGGEATTDIDWDTGTGLVNSTTKRLRALELLSLSNDVYTAGTHQFKVRWKVSGGTGNLFELQIGYVILGI